MSKPTYTIGVTGLNAIDSPGPGIGVIKSLKEARSFNTRIIGFSYENLEPGIYMHDLVDKTYSIPYPSVGTEVLFERLRYIHSKEKLDFIFPNFDAELFNFIKLEKRLSDELNIKMVLPTLEQFEARHKSNLYEYGKKYDILVPYSKTIYQVYDLHKCAEELGFPMVVKGQYYDAYVTYTIDQAIQYFYKISSKWGLPILVQAFIQGNEVNVCGAGDGKGNLIGAVPMRKLYITDKGKAWAGVSLDDEKLLEVTKKLVKNTKWRGPFELELIKTKNEEYYLLEINPRFPAWCYLTAGCGQNLAEALVNLAINNKTKRFKNYVVGKMFIRYSMDMIVDIKEFETISTLGEL